MVGLFFIFPVAVGSSLWIAGDGLWASLTAALLRQLILGFLFIVSQKLRI